jgi:hypothetical protein
MVKKDKDSVFVLCPHAHSGRILCLYYLLIWIVKKDKISCVSLFAYKTQQYAILFLMTAVFAVSIIEFSSNGNIVILLFSTCTDIFLPILYLSRKLGYVCMLPLTKMAHVILTLTLFHLHLLYVCF